MDWGGEVMRRHRSKWDIIMHLPYSPSLPPLPLSLLSLSPLPLPSSIPLPLSLSLSTHIQPSRVVQDVKLSNEVHGLGLVSLQSQLEETQTTLKSNVDTMETLKNEFYQRESQLQSEQKQLSEVVAMQQKQLSQKQVCPE